MHVDDKRSRRDVGPDRLERPGIDTEHIALVVAGHESDRATARREFAMPVTEVFADPARADQFAVRDETQVHERLVTVRGLPEVRANGYAGGAGRERDGGGQVESERAGLGHASSIRAAAQPVDRKMREIGSGPERRQPVIAATRC